MHISIEGLQLSKKFEGFRSDVYRDIAGYMTIGYVWRWLDSFRWSRSK